MTDTLNNLLQRTAAELNNACVSFAMLKGYLDAQAQKDDSDIKTRAEASFFTEEEYKEMPKLKDGRTRITPDGYYQIRYRKDGYDIQFTSKQLQVVKSKFREWVKSVSDKKRLLLPKKTQIFREFVEKYFEEVKRQNVSAYTYALLHRRMTVYIFPVLGEQQIKSITPLKCQSLLNGILADGKGRTAEDIKCILNEVFRAAVGEKLITGNPMQFVKIPKHQRENGVALSLHEVGDIRMQSLTLVAVQFKRNAVCRSTRLV